MSLSVPAVVIFSQPANRVRTDTKPAGNMMLTKANFEDVKGCNS